MNRRIWSLAVCIGMILALLTSSAYLIVEAHHDCTGEDCDICEHIAEMEALLASMAYLGIVALMMLSVLAVVRTLLSDRTTANLRAATLVCLKVRLND